MTASSDDRPTEAEFAALAARAGLRLSLEKQASVYETFCELAALATRVHRPRDVAAEPAVVFTLVSGADHR